jgi:hypothetical protein
MKPENIDCNKFMWDVDRANQIVTYYHLQKS